MTGDQGVIIPKLNMVNLNLPEEVVQACAEGREIAVFLTEKANSTSFQ